MKVVIAGGTGQIGQMLKREYLKRGYEVVILSRSPQNKEGIHWDAKTLGPWTAELEGADWVVNLAGRTVNCRYTDKNLKAMMDSRIESTEILGKAVEQCQNPPAMWFQMSTATIYAHTFGKANDEFTGVIGGNEPDVPRYWDYSIEIGKNWEKVLENAKTPKTHKVALRSAMLMSPDKKGVYDELSKLAIMGLGGSIAGGKQFMSWIHEKDFVQALDFIAQNKMEGPVNLSSPNPLPQKEFMKILRQNVGQPVGLPATKLMAEIGAFFMRTDTELVLKSRKVIPGKLLKAGYKFEYDNWEEACDELTVRKERKLLMHFCMYATFAFLFTGSWIGTWDARTPNIIIDTLGRIGWFLGVLASPFYSALE